eukprot:Partr_v1_DN29027_c0_g1_i1_m59006 putative Enoyl CoA hydratase 1, peroxisomal
MQFIKVAREKAGHVAVVSLNRPEKLNAISNQFYDEIKSCFDAISSDPDIRVAVLTGGESKHFTAGLDLQDPSLQEIMESSGDPGRRALKFHQLITRWQSAFSSVEACRKPVIACIHGACIGAGIDLTTACDIRYCTTDTSFAVKEVDIGIAADLGTLQRLGKVVGNQSMVRELCLTGRRFDSQLAQSLGLVGVVFPTRVEMLKHAMDVADDIASKSPVAVIGTKAALVHARDHSVAEGLAFISHWNASMLQSVDVAAAMRAQLMKTKGDFSKL